MPRLLHTEDRVGLVVAVVNDLLAHRTGQARHRALERAARSRPPGLGALALLPADLDDVVAARAWLAWCELARCDDAIGTVVGEASDDEHHLLASTLGELGEPGEDRVDVTRAVVEGLRVAVCRPVRPLPLERARDLLSDFVGDGG